MAFDFLDPKFIQAMNEIGEYGFAKYGPLPTDRDKHSDPARVTDEEMLRHSVDHFLAYLNGIPHDHFNTRRHQLAAVAFNAMMEFTFAGLGSEA